MTSNKEMAICYLSLGTNLGDRHCNLDEAVQRIGQKVGTVQQVSSYHHTKPWGYQSENYFLNACVRVQTRLTPHALLKATQTIEREMGRTLKSNGGEYHDRIIDIDILLYNNVRVDEPDLQIPHPLMYERDFVMKPLMEIKI